MLLKADSVSYTIQSKRLIHNLSFVIEENQVISIIWYNGSWKSTLLKILLWTLAPSAWTITRSTWTVIWYVPQKLSFLNQIPLTVKDFIRIYNGKKYLEKMTSSWLLDIQDLQDKPLHGLSGGQLQKVLIHNALIGSPDVLFLDEPTAWLDIQAQKEFYALIDELHHEAKISIVLVSHDIHTVYSKSDKVICLHNWSCCTWSPSSEEFSAEVSNLLGGYVAPYLHTHSHPW